MELPEDVLRIVKDYAAPLYPKYLAQYEDAFATIGNGPWPGLKEKLKTRDAPKVLVIITALKEAYLMREKKYDIMGDLLGTQPMFSKSVLLARTDFENANKEYYRILHEMMKVNLGVHWAKINM